MEVIEDSAYSAARGILLQMKKTSWVIPVSMVLSLYTAFVAMCMWNWFATKAFHTARVTYLEMLGIVWLVRLLINKPSSWDAMRWTRLHRAIDAFIPGDSKNVLVGTIAERKETMWSDLANATFGQLVSNTITLVLGFAVSFLI